MNAPSFYVRDVPIYGNTVLAPMSGYSDLPFRSICRSLGSAMSYTEFVAAPGLLRNIPSLYRKLLFTPAERPIVFQIYGAREDELVEAALRIQELQPDIIDINMGCWSPAVADNGAGAGLLCDPSKIGHIFARLTQALEVPVTGKIRLGWDDSSLNHRLVARILAENGASLIAVHGRTKAQAYKGNANWQAIAEVCQTVSIPVLGNGDVKSPADITRMMAETGCQGVMIGRAAIGNPWIFAHKEREQVTPAERAEMLIRHMTLAIEYYGAELGFDLFQRHATKYISGFAGAAHLRASLANAKNPSGVLYELTAFA
ncbi:MAG TPA: tRNA dihydrouridine synthase DusB [Anaerolineales bacterium]|nr:tRNA dihydrouridine synthase DusB [Anaerolineales bacterium]